jgi:hypothetical protein
MKQTFVTVFSAGNVSDADLIRSRLEVAGFHPVVLNEHSVNLFWGGFGVPPVSIDIQVPESEANNAKEFLDAPAAPAE